MIRPFARAALVVAINMAIGAIIWRLWPISERELWDTTAGIFLYVGLMVAAGALSFAVDPKRYWWACLGLAAGQIAATPHAASAGPFGPVPWLLMIGASALALIGGLAGMLFKALAARRRSA